MRGNPIRDDLLRGRLSRRDLNKMLAAAGLSLVAMPLGRNARAAAGMLAERSPALKANLIRR